MRVVAFSFLTPFFFLKGGMNVSASALWANLGILALLFVGKITRNWCRHLSAGATWHLRMRSSRRCS